MAYISQTDLAGLIPDEFLEGALKDGVGDEEIDTDLWDGIQAAVSDEIDGKLGLRYTVPFSTVPGLVKDAARKLTLWWVYKRRGVTDEANPWSDARKAILAWLDRVAEGDEQLAGVDPIETTDGTVIGETAKTLDEGGRLMV